MTTTPPTPHRTVRRVASPPPDRGSATVELVLLAPLLVGILLFVIACGRAVSVQLDVDAAAHAAARSASLARTAGQAQAYATQAATATLSQRRACTGLTASVDTAGLTASATVTVTVTCNVPFSDLAMLAVPGDHNVTSTATAPIDTWRAAP